MCGNDTYNKEVHVANSNKSWAMFTKNDKSHLKTAKNVRKRKDISSGANVSEITLSMAEYTLPANGDKLYNSKTHWELRLGTETADTSNIKD